ncbi:MAG TPA: N-acetylmuramoyl-L-alanine amidase [Longimicrobium sp.]|nr:N-acetylmuramoyl-L-alanine amidase [Longimicrobium sp.]
MQHRIARLALAAAAFLIAACATTSTNPAARTTTGEAGPSNSVAEDPRRGTLPPVPARNGALVIDVVYPAEGAELTAADSNFIFGSVGNGQARLTINGQPVEVAANGAFLGFLPVPPNGVYTLVAEVRSGGQTQSSQQRRTVRVPVRQEPPAAGGPLSIVAGSVTPSGALTVTEAEPVTVRFRATPGATARLLLADGSSVPLVERRVAERSTAFAQDAAPPREFAEYAGTFVPRATTAAPRLAAAPGGAGAPTVTQADAGSRGTIEMIRGRDTLRMALPASIGVLRPGETRVAVAAGDRPDSTVIAQALPGGNTPYQWFFPVGTRLAIDGEREGFLRARLDDDVHVWIDARSLRLLPAGTPAPEGTVGTVRVVPAAEWVDLRLSTSDRLPFRVNAEGNEIRVEVFGAQTRTNWAHYGPDDALVRRLSWDQPRDGVFTARLETAEPVWGWRSFYDAGGTLVVRVRRPPRIDRARPLAGRFIAVDAGHPPGGAIGPTRLTEADANLAIAKRLVRMLREAGARVLETRPDTAAVALGARPLMAERANAELLVSVHNNAFPDGVNPFTHNGTTAFYNAPQGMELTRAFQRELLAELGLRDLGIARADLALVRSTWFPATLTETMFLMVPQQEAALRDPAVQERIARAHFRAIESFLRSRAR